MRSMVSADRITADALALDAPDRARVARELLRSLDGGVEPGALDERTVELSRRLAAIEDGSVELVDLDEVKGLMAERRVRRRAQQP